MKKSYSTYLVIVIALIGCLYISFGTGCASKAKPVLEVAGPADTDKKPTMVISGTGFQPGQAIAILLTTDDGVETDIGYALKPDPKADSNGAWTTKWSYERFIKRKIVKAGESYKLTATDQEYNSLAETVFSFEK
jgi:hypothetical protein